MASPPSFAPANAAAPAAAPNTSSSSTQEISTSHTSDIWICSKCLWSGLLQLLSPLPSTSAVFASPSPASFLNRIFKCSLTKGSFMSNVPGLIAPSPLLTLSVHSCAQYMSIEESDGAGTRTLSKSQLVSFFLIYICRVQDEKLTTCQIITASHSTCGART